VRNGRSYTTRSVVARQSIGAIFNMSVSFSAVEDAIEVQTAVMPEIPPPGELPVGGWGTLFDRRFAPPLAKGQVAGWMRLGEEAGDEDILQACAFAYLSDDMPTDAIAALHPAQVIGDEFHQRFFSASLDHAIWFHRPFRADEWHVHTYTCHGLIASRGLSVGYAFTPDGTHVATISQEVLFRELRRGRRPTPGWSASA